MSNEEPFETVKHRGFDIKLYQDDNPFDPREDDNLGTMVCFHRRYDLGDKHDLKSGDFGGWADIREHLVEQEEAVVILPLYLYDHSGITMSTVRNYPFNDRWDSMTVGFIYASRDTILKEYGVKRISKQLKDKVERLLDGEVGTYDDYLTGNVCGYMVDDVGSLWGFYGDEGRKDALEQAESEIDYHIKQKVKHHAEYLKNAIKNNVPLMYRKPLTLRG